MSKIKTVTCLLTGEEITKKQSVIVQGHRVKKELEHIAKAILINGAKVLSDNWCKNTKSSNNRLKALAMSICVIRECQEIFNIDPMIYVVEITRLCEEAGDPLPMTFVQKLVDFINGEDVYELSKPNVKRAIDAGFKVLVDGIKEGIK